MAFSRVIGVPDASFLVFISSPFLKCGSVPRGTQSCHVLESDAQPSTAAYLKELFLSELRSGNFTRFALIGVARPTYSFGMRAECILTCLTFTAEYRRHLAR